jgi:hypothetical protein
VFCLWFLYVCVEWNKNFICMYMIVDYLIFI